MGSNSSAKIGVLHPIRSISLPSRLDSNPFEEELNKLKSSKIPSGSSAETIQEGLVSLAELYNCMTEAIQSPHTQQALHQHQNQHASLIEEALEGSVGLLDTCSSAKDLILIMKQHVQDLQSVLRRRTGRDSSIETTTQAYICFRKKAKKDIIAKCLRVLKKMDYCNNIASSDVDVDHHLVVIVVRLLRELSAIAVSIFRSLMVFLSEPVVKNKWSLVRKLVPTMGSVQIVNEVGAVDCAVQCLHGQMMKKNDEAKIDVKMVQGRLERLEATMKDLEGGLDCIFRCLIQNRVALLNILTP